jgi:hypothetical protein
MAQHATRQYHILVWVSDSSPSPRLVLSALKIILLALSLIRQPRMLKYRFTVCTLAWIVHTVRFHVLIISTISDGIRKQYVSGQVQWRRKVQKKDTLATMLFSNSGSTMPLSSGSIVLLSSSDVSYLVELTKFGFYLFS